MDEIKNSNIKRGMLDNHQPICKIKKAHENMRLNYFNGNLDYCVIFARIYLELHTHPTTKLRKQATKISPPIV